VNSLELHADDRVVVMSLTPESFARAQATPADTEDIVNEPLRIASVVVSVLLVDQGDGVIRINFRSKAPDPLGVRPNVDVAAIAKEFGGGGHRHAAGARSKDSLYCVREKVITRLRAAIV
jgi:phosphoesterase RecJ-like protein